MCRHIFVKPQSTGHIPNMSAIVHIPFCSGSRTMARTKPAEAHRRLQDDHTRGKIALEIADALR